MPVFIDDIFLLFQGTAQELHTFHSFINTSREHLKFTLTFYVHETSFVDILIKREGVALARIYTGSQRMRIPCYAEIASTIYTPEKELPYQPIQSHAQDLLNTE